MATYDDLKKENEKLKKQLRLAMDESSGRSVEDLELENEELAKILEKTKDRVVKEEAAAMHAKNRREILAIELETLRKMIASGHEDLENQRKKVEVLKESLEVEKEMSDARREGAQATEDLAKSLAGAMRVTRGGVVDVGKIASGMGKAAKAAKGLAAGGKIGLESIAKFLTALSGNVLISVLQIMVDLATAIFKVSYGYENTTRAMQQATGMSRELADTISAGIPDVRQYTHEFELLAEAATALYRGFTDFTLINKQTAADMASNAQMLSRLGVSYDSFAGSVQMATKGMGVHADDAAAMMRNLTAHAQNIGTDIGQLTSAFAASGGELTKFGGDGVATFKRLSETSKITGIDIQRLLAITEKFDTFEGAAEQAGTLNAALGGNFVNAMDLMMETDPRARFDMIRDSIQSTAGSFKDMGYYQRIYMAKAAGLKDVGELALMMSGNYELLDENMGKNADSYIEQAKKARQWQSVQEELKTVFMAMVPEMKEAMDMFKTLMNWLQGTGKDDIQEMFKGIQSIIKWLAKEENFKTILNTAGGLARNLDTIAYAFGAIFAAGTGAQAMLFYKKWKQMGDVAKIADALGKTATGAKGGADAARAGKAAKDVVVTGGSAAERAQRAKAAADAAEAARKAKQAKRAQESLTQLKQVTPEWKKAKDAANAASTAADSATKTGRFTKLWNSMKTGSKGAWEATKKGFTSMDKQAVQLGQQIKNSGVGQFFGEIIKKSPKASRVLGNIGKAAPAVAKVAGPLALVYDAWVIGTGAVKGYNDAIERGASKWEVFTSTVSGGLQGLAESWQGLMKMIGLGKSDEGYVDLSTKEQGVSDKLRKRQVEIQKAMLLRTRKGVDPAELLAGDAAHQKHMEAQMKKTGTGLGESLTSGVDKGAADLKAHSLSNFAKNVLEGITLAEEPLFQAMTAPFVRAETQISQIQQNIISQQQTMSAAIAKAREVMYGETPPPGMAGPTGANAQNQQPVVVQIMMDGAVVREEMIGTIGQAAGFSAVTGYVRK